MNKEILCNFRKLKLCGQRSVTTQEHKNVADKAVIQYLQSLLDENNICDFEDIGFCYWNISDSYALLRDGPSLFCNHQRFYEHLRQGEPKYLYWLVCDATQRLTLEYSGYSDFWWRLYHTATEQHIDNSELFAEFSAHRAALYFCNLLPLNEDNLDFVKHHFEMFLNRAKTMDEYNFYRIIYLTLISRYLKADWEEIIHISTEMLSGLALPKTVSSSLVGEWKAIITPFDKRKQSEVGIVSAVNSMIYSDNITLAKQLYDKAREAGMKANCYIEARIKK